MEDIKDEVVHVEILQKATSSLKSCDIIREVHIFLEKRNTLITEIAFSNEVLPDEIECFRICTNRGVRKELTLNDVLVKYYVYQNCSVVPCYEAVDTEGDDSFLAGLSWELPHAEFDGLWENLIFEDETKSQLLNYVQASFLYSENAVNSNIIKWNRIVLLYGPPGIGKTSLCKALAQKIAIRLGKRYSRGHLIEINTHSLFSKWYSESPKLVFKMFNTIKQLLTFEDTFVIALMDEVESLIHSRQSSGIEPFDSIRVVNTVLTQLDHLQMHKNFILLATSNVTKCIDIAFADRADLKLLIQIPTTTVAYKIFCSCILELLRCKLISGDPSEIPDITYVPAAEFSKVSHPNTDLLLSMCPRNFNGRTLRKIPFLTYMKFIDKSKPNIKTFLTAMSEVIRWVKRNDHNYY